MSEPFIYSAPAASDREHSPMFVCRDLSGPAPLTPAAVKEMVAPYAGKSVAECYAGPYVLMESGTAVLILIARDTKALERLCDAKRVALIMWRWDITPSAFVSFSLTMSGGATKPAPRWFAPDNTSVVQQVRRALTVTFVVATPSGRMSPWFVGRMESTPGNPRRAQAAMEAVFAGATPGIPFTTVGARTLVTVGAKRDLIHEIPYASDPVSDFWFTLGFASGLPWSDEISTEDKARAVWATAVNGHVGTAARHLQLISERHQFDGEPPIVAAKLFPDAPPLVHRLLDAIAGAKPDLGTAREAAYAVVNESDALRYAINVALATLEESEWDLHTAFVLLFKAGLLDSRLTDAGRCRPWLQGNVLRTTPVNLRASESALRHLWENACQMMYLLEAGTYCTPETMPVAPERLVAGMRGVKLDAPAQEAKDRIDALLLEARDARQWSVPWGARVALDIGPFRGLRIYEFEREFICHFLDQNDDFYPVAIDLRQAIPTYGTLPLSGEEDGNGAGRLALTLITAAVLRDFLVVEDRDAVFTARTVRRHRDGRRETIVVYLPRVHYSRQRANPEPVDPDTLARARHGVQQHLRKVQKASEHQRLLAREYGVYLPSGYTFVRPHQRGGLDEAERKRIYRSRSASAMLFDAIDPGPNTTAPLWFKFERDCAAILRQRRMKVIHHAANARDGDGGMDLYAIDDNDEKVVVQCKCWAFDRVIGPEIVRELAGTMQLVDKDSGSTSRGMLITTTTFTDGAVLAAKELGIELIDGASFAGLLAALPEH